MSQISFFTPVYYGPNATAGKKALENIDNYFHICGKKAFVIPTGDREEKVILLPTKFSILTLIKTMGIALSYFTVVIPLIMLISKAALRSSHNFKRIDPKEELEKGCDVQAATVSKIQALLPEILKGEENEVEYLNGSKIFRFKDTPNTVFKMGIASNSRCERKGKWLDGKELMEDRFENMIKAKEVCLVNNLGLLIIPCAKKITFTAHDGREVVMIAEESMDINPEESAQEEFYHTYSKELNETARQLAIFVAKTGFNDVVPRNIPIINEAKDYLGPRRVALIDLEHIENVMNGFTGDDRNGSCGLLHCVSEEQIDIVIAEAAENGIKINNRAKESRLQEIASDKKLRQHYKNKGIVTGKEPIQVDVDSLGLNLKEEDKIRATRYDENNGRVKWFDRTITMKEAVQEIVEEINRLIQQKSDNESLKGKRSLLLSTDEGTLFGYYDLGITKIVNNKEADKQRWLNQILQALANNGDIFKLIKNNNYGYFIQA